MSKSRRLPSNIPSDEDFARASAKMAAQNRLFATVRERVVRSFFGRAPLHEIFLFPGPESDYDAYVFYKLNIEIEACRRSGVEQLLKDAILREFVAQNNDGQVPTVTFKFDSDENVRKRCNGNYFKYLH